MFFTPRRLRVSAEVLPPRAARLRNGNDARHRVGPWLPATVAFGALAACSSPATTPDGAMPDVNTVVECGAGACVGPDVHDVDASAGGDGDSALDSSTDSSPPIDTSVAPDVAPTDARGGDEDVATGGGDVTDAGALAVLPALDPATTANVRSILATGATMGNRPHVFAKIGDSISESASFLQDIGHGWEDLGTYTSLMDSVTYFSSVTFSDGSNSFDRASVSAVGGWTSADALAPMGGASAYVNELNAIHPAWAVIMYGTNDVDHWGVDVLTTNLTQMITQAEGLGVVPILSTIPDREDAPDKEPIVLTFNSAIRALAHSQHVPYVDYWYAMQPLPSRGIGADGIHPNAYTGPDGLIDACVFTSAGLQYGYNMRNLVVVQVLDLMRTTFEP